MRRHSGGWPGSAPAAGHASPLLWIASASIRAPPLSTHTHAVVILVRRSFFVTVGSKKDPMSGSTDSVELCETASSSGAVGGTIAPSFEPLAWLSFCAAGHRQPAASSLSKGVAPSCWSGNAEGVTGSETPPRPGAGILPTTSLGSEAATFFTFSRSLFFCLGALCAARSASRNFSAESSPGTSAVAPFGPASTRIAGFCVAAAAGCATIGRRAVRGSDRQGGKPGKSEGKEQKRKINK